MCTQRPKISGNTKSPKIGEFRNYITPVILVRGYPLIHKLNVFLDVTNNKAIVLLSSCKELLLDLIIILVLFLNCHVCI